MNIKNNTTNKRIQFMVHCFRTESVVFRGTEKECKEYIDENDSAGFPLELYVACEGQKHFREDVQSYDSSETEYWDL